MTNRIPTTMGANQEYMIRFDGQFEDPSPSSASAEPPPQPAVVAPFAGRVISAEEEEEQVPR